MINTSETTPKHIVPPLHPALQFLIFVAVFTGVFIVGNCIGVGIVTLLYGMKIFTAISQMNTNIPHFIPAMWIIQLSGTTLPVLAAALLFSTLVVKNTKEYIKPNINISWVLMALVFAIMFFSLPVIELLSNLNQKVPLPHFLQWMKDSEEATEKLTNAFLQMKTVWQMLFNLIFIGLLTAIVEEFMFRGVIQTILVKWTKNIHVSIWITAFLFSAVHMEFYGFLPRFLLGGMLGYFVAWSGSIWPAVFAHFLNNGTAVVVTYLSQNKMIGINADDQHVFNWAAYTISVGFILFLFYVYHQAAIKKPEQVNGEELG